MAGERVICLFLQHVTLDFSRLGTYFGVSGPDVILVKIKINIFEHNYGCCRYTRW
jgi:hypothetical protein